MQTDDYLWVSITMKNNWFVHTGEIDDRFEGSWEDGYICGHEEAVQIPDAELRSAIVEEFRRAQMQRRRSADSGYPAQDDEGNY